MTRLFSDHYDYTVWARIERRMNRTFSEGRVVARKEHACTRCSQPIAKGETYFRWVGVLEGDFAPAKLHVLCPDQVAPDEKLVASDDGEA